MSIRRLPVYLVLDVSGSMSGEPIESLRQGLKALVSDLRSDPQALETAYLSVIEFGSGAGQTVPLTELCQFQEPQLQAGGNTSYGLALSVLSECLAKDILVNTPKTKGDYKPLVFVMTDGGPTDQWAEPAEALRKRTDITIVACAAGPSADEKPLLALTETVVRLSSLQPDQFSAFFKWVSASIKISSHKLGKGDDRLPPPPSIITVIP